VGYRPDLGQTQEVTGVCVAAEIGKLILRHLMTQIPFYRTFTGRRFQGIREMGWLDTKWHGIEPQRINYVVYDLEQPQ